VLIVDKMRGNRLRWFGYVMKRENWEAVRTVMGMNVKGIRRSSWMLLGVIRIADVCVKGCGRSYQVEV